MASEFIGTWKATKPAGEAEGFDKFFKEMKVEEGMIEHFKNIIFGSSLSLEKGIWTLDLLADGQVVKSTTFESGKEYETKGFDEKMHRMTITVDGCKSVEKSAPVDGSTKGTSTTRVVKDGVMTVTSLSIENPACSMTYTMKKQ
ncbi:uncharacterized protein [Argopecten irradians]|uniref:uncharacterized protein n=1 Tax=Argopecten irradians TaxID=31199 RepID=UPI003713A869